METSAKTAMNVNDIFLAIGKSVCLNISLPYEQQREKTCFGGFPTRSDANGAVQP